MSEFNLYSIDWTSVSLVDDAHLATETAYLEQLARWGMRYGHAGGVIEMARDDLRVHGSPEDYEIALSRCKALTPGGFLVDVDEARPVEPLRGSTSRHRDAFVPIYLGVALEKTSVAVAPARSAALLECRALCWNYVLSCEQDSAERDWLLVGRMRKDGSRFVRDDDFIPPCAHLRSHPSMEAVAREITRIAGDCIAGIEGQMRGHRGGEFLAWRTMMGLIAHGLAPAAVLVDWEAHPRSYLERLIGLLRGQAALINVVEATDSRWRDANDRIQAALKHVADGEAQQDWFWGEAFRLVKEALIALVTLFGEIVPGASVETPAASTSSVRVLAGDYQPVRRKP
jgi:hypothetical protein